MLSFFRFTGTLFRIGRCALLAATLLGVAGCEAWKPHEETYPDNDLSKTVRKVRPKNDDVDYSGLSERGRQIERDLSAQ